MNYDIPDVYYWSLCVVMLMVLAYQFRIQFPIRKRTKMQDRPEEPPGPTDYMDLAPGVYRAKNLARQFSNLGEHRFSADLIGVGQIMFYVPDIVYPRQGWAECLSRGGDFNVMVGAVRETASHLRYRHVDTIPIPIPIGLPPWEAAPPTPLSEFPDLDDLFNGE